MQSQYWWNASFDDLMVDFNAWLQTHPHITIVHTDWKYVHRPQDPSGAWYMLLIYRH